MRKPLNVALLANSLTTGFALFALIVATTFAGINPGHIAPFVAAQFVGAGVGLALDRFLGASSCPTIPEDSQ